MKLVILKNPFLRHHALILNFYPKPNTFFVVYTFTGVQVVLRYYSIFYTKHKIRPSFSVNVPNLFVEVRNLFVEPFYLIVEPQNLIVEPQNLIVEPLYLIVEPFYLNDELQNLIVEPFYLIVEVQNLIPNNLIFTITILKPDSALDFATDLFIRESALEKKQNLVEVNCL